MEYYGHNDYRDYIAHHGVKGMKWGKHLFGLYDTLTGGRLTAYNNNRIEANRLRAKSQQYRAHMNFNTGINRSFGTRGNESIRRFAKEGTNIYSRQAYALDRNTDRSFEGRVENAYKTASRATSNAISNGKKAVSRILSSAKRKVSSFTRDMHRVGQRAVNKYMMKHTSEKTKRRNYLTSQSKKRRNANYLGYGRYLR